MKAIITISNDAMHIIRDLGQFGYFENIEYFTTYNVQWCAAIVAQRVKWTNADLYFAPSCKRSFVEAIIKAMGK